MNLSKISLFFNDSVYFVYSHQWELTESLKSLKNILLNENSCYSALVYAEVETRIGALRSLLLEKLLQTPSTLHDQKRYIRSLNVFIILFHTIVCIPLSRHVVLFTHLTLFDLFLRNGFIIYTLSSFFPLFGTSHISQSLHVSHNLYTLRTVCVHLKSWHFSYTPSLHSFFGFFDVFLCHRLPELHRPSTFFCLPLAVLWMFTNLLSCLLSRSLVSVSIFPSSLPFFPSFSPSILLSIHTCGLSRFIIVKTDLSGSQRPVLNHTATSFILLH